MARSFFAVCFLLAISIFVNAAPVALNITARQELAQAAQIMNAKFITIKLTDPCTSGQQACVSKGKASCVNGAWSIQQCSSNNSTRCYAIPTETQAGFELTCATQNQTLATMVAFGVQGGSTGGPGIGGGILPAFFNWTSDAMNTLNSALAGTQTPKAFQKTQAAVAHAAKVTTTAAAHARRSASASATATGSVATATTSTTATLSPASLKANAINAQKLNSAFMILSADDQCTTGQACVGRALATCVNGTWQTSTCTPSGTECYAVPSLTQNAAVHVACTTTEAAEQVMAQAGLQGLYDLEDASSSSTSDSSTTAPSSSSSDANNAAATATATFSSTTVSTTGNGAVTTFSLAPTTAILPLDAAQSLISSLIANGGSIVVSTAATGSAATASATSTSSGADNGDGNGDDSGDEGNDEDGCEDGSDDDEHHHHHHHSGNATTTAGADGSDNSQDNGQDGAETTTVTDTIAVSTVFVAESTTSTSLATSTTASTSSSSTVDAASATSTSTSSDSAISSSVGDSKVGAVNNGSGGDGADSGSDNAPSASQSIIQLNPPSATAASSVINLNL